MRAEENEDGTGKECGWDVTQDLVCNYARDEGKTLKHGHSPGPHIREPGSFQTRHQLWHDDWIRSNVTEQNLDMYSNHNFAVLIIS